MCSRRPVKQRLLTDSGSAFIAAGFVGALERLGIRHCRTRPAHPWTSGRIERVFSTLKQSVRQSVWLFASVPQVERFCRDFLLWHNRDRPHSAWGGRTPDEVWFGRKKRLRPLGRVDYFVGTLHWWRFADSWRRGRGRPGAGPLTTPSSSSPSGTSGSSHAFFRFGQVYFGRSWTFVAASPIA
jgi:hypothetical protein